MSKRKLIGLTEAWWVWIGEDSAVRVENENDAKSLLLLNGKEYGIENSYNRCDFASPVAELLWNIPLAQGQSYHKIVLSPLMLIKHNNKIRKIIKPISPSKAAKLFKSWYELDLPSLAWIPNQYNMAMNDSDCLLIKGKKSLTEQCDIKWPL